MQITSNGKNYKVSRHAKMGLVIYDPDSQMDVRPEHVRLFVVAENRMATFTRAVESMLVQPYSCNGYQNSSENMRRQEVKRAVDLYVGSRSAGRQTHCYRCKAHINSTDFSICPRCKWIRCSCGACGCGYDYIQF